MTASPSTPSTPGPYCSWKSTDLQSCPDSITHPGEKQRCSQHWEEPVLPVAPWCPQPLAHTPSRRTHIQTGSHSRKVGALEKEGTSHKLSWYCSTRRTATRVESVVWSIWPEMRRLTPPLIMKVDKRLHAFSSAASSISHLARERWLEQKTLEGHKKSYAWGVRPFLKGPWNKSYY